MKIENFISDKVNFTVSWNYRGESIDLFYENLNYAYDNKEHYYVLVNTGEDLKMNQVYYLSYEGKEIFRYDRINYKVWWSNKDRDIELDCPGVFSAEYYIEHQVVLLITEINENTRILYGYDFNGSLLFSKEEPVGKRFTNVSASAMVPTVVCLVGPEDTDQWGRDLYHHSINLKTGELIKASFAYS